MRRIAIGAVLPLCLVATGLAVAIFLRADPPAEKALPEFTAAALIPYLPLAEVEMVKSLGDESLNLSVSGTVEPFREIQLAAEAAGRIVEKDPVIRSGNHVKKGQILYRIDPRDYELEIERLTRRLEQERAALKELEQDVVNSRALLVVAEKELALADASVNRLEQLSANFSSQEELDQAKRTRLTSMNQKVNLENQIRSFNSRVARLEAAAKLAETELSKANLNLDRTLIRSPVDGRIVQEDVEVDSYVQRGTRLVIIEDTSKIEVACNVRMDRLSWLLDKPTISTDQLVNAFQSDSYSLPPTPVDVCFQVAGRESESLIWQGVLDRFDGNGLDPQSRTVPLRIRVDKPTEFTNCDGTPVSTPGPTTLVRGMFVNVVIKSQPSTKLMLIPKLGIKPAFDAENSSASIVWKFSPSDSAWQETEIATKVNPDSEGYTPQEKVPGSELATDTRKAKVNVDEWQTGHLEIVENVRMVAPYWNNKDIEYWVCEVPLNKLAPNDWVIVNPLPGIKADGTDPVRFNKKQPSETTNVADGVADSSKGKIQS